MQIPKMNGINNLTKAISALLIKPIKIDNAIEP